MIIIDEREKKMYYSGYGKFSNFFVVLVVLILLVLFTIGFLIKGERFEMYQEATGKKIEVKRGFSFTYMFFGPFVPLFRGHIGGFFLTLFIELCSCGLGRLILLFCYNGMYINWLAKNGYRRIGIVSNASQNKFPVNIQINSGDGQSNVGTQKEAINLSEVEQSQVQKKEKKMSKISHFSLDRRKENEQKYQKANSVLQPVSGEQDIDDDDGETVALKKGAIIGLQGQYQGAEIFLDSGSSIVIGRDVEKSNLVIAEKQISRQHCSVFYDAFHQCYTVTDYSTNGVYLKDGSQLISGQPTFLYSGDTIKLGNTEHVFQLK